MTTVAFPRDLSVSVLHQHSGTKRRECHICLSTHECDNQLYIISAFGFCSKAELFFFLFFSSRFLHLLPLWKCILTVHTHRYPQSIRRCCNVLLMCLDFCCCCFPWTLMVQLCVGPVRTLWLEWTDRFNPHYPEALCALHLITWKLSFDAGKILPLIQCEPSAAGQEGSLLISFSAVCVCVCYVQYRKTWTILVCVIAISYKSTTTLTCQIIRYTSIKLLQYHKRACSKFSLPGQSGLEHQRRVEFQGSKPPVESGPFSTPLHPRCGGDFLNLLI